MAGNAGSWMVVRQAGELKQAAEHTTAIGGIMPETREEYAKRIIQRADEAGDIFTLEDGFYYFGPSTGGAMSAELLRVIADELDRRNEGWASTIEEYFAGKQ